MDKKYYERLTDKQLERKLHSSGCVLVKGPKFCGKSTTCLRFASSSTELKTTNAINLALADPRSTLTGSYPHLIDEWQKCPEIWNIVKDDLDRDYQFGKYILTGSTTPVDESKIQHSGAGRISSLIMRPMSLYESKESIGIISLSSLFDTPMKSDQVVYDNPLSLQDVAFLMVRGGWPISVLADKNYALDVTANYYEGLFEIENESDDYARFLKGKDKSVLILILKEYARNISTQAKKKSMINDILQSGIKSTLQEDTFDSYLEILLNLFLVFEMPAWNVNLRSSVQVRSTPTHHFYDTSIALACLGIKPSDLLKDLNSFGMFFEDFAVRDLSVYASSINATLKHYRDSNGQEVDAIIELSNGKYAAIEIKIASEKNISEGISSLKRFSKYMENQGQRKPEFCMVLTSHGSCYIAEEGIYVVPLNCLKD